MHGHIKNDSEIFKNRLRLKISYVVNKTHTNRLEVFEIAKTTWVPAGLIRN